MKKVFIYLFLAFLLFNFSSVMLALKLMQWQSKFEMSQKLKHQQKTERLTFHKNKFKQRLQRGSEFDWDNKRYDVVDATYCADSIYIEAVDDKREKSILNYLCKLVFKKYKESKNPSKISNLSLLIFQAPLPEEVSFNLPVNEHSCNYYFEIQRINKVYRQIQAPPPRFI